MPTLVLSDIHFGVDDCSIGTCSEGRDLPRRGREQRERIIGRLINYLNDLRIRRVILLGDIFDLQLSNLATAIRASTTFLQRLRGLRTLREIVYIPGNHDHLLWFMHVFRRHVVEELQRGAAGLMGDDFKVCSNIENRTNVFSNRYSFMRNIFGVNLNVKVIYPFLKETIRQNGNNKRYFFTHGHFFDNQQTIYYELVKKLYPVASFLLKMDFGRVNDPNIDELELYCLPLYNMFTMFGHTFAGRTRMKEIYKTYKQFKWQTDLVLDDKKVIDRIDKFLTRYGGEEGANQYYHVMDYLIFGHTHSPDINMFLYPTPQLKVINTGCWIPSDRRVGNFLVIDPTAEFPKLMTIDQMGTINEEEFSAQMRNGERPRRKRTFF